jgi:hypothetical protein
MLKGQRDRLIASKNYKAHFQLTLILLNVTIDNYQKALKAMYLIMANPFSCFQFEPRVNQDDIDSNFGYG